MSIVPLLYAAASMDPWEMRRMRRNDWDRFGVGLNPSDIRDLMEIPRVMSDLTRRTMKEAPATIGKDGFQVNVDVQQFRPNEMTVRVVDNTVVVEGKHEERQDEHGYISRHFVRKYPLPKGYNPDHVTSTLSSDGVLTITAPKPNPDKATSERVIQIQQTGPAHINVKDNQTNTAPGEQEKKKA